MSWRDAIALAATSVRRSLGRAALTVSAVALAAALLTALLTIAGTARTRVLDQLSKGGPLSGIQVAAAEPDPGEIDQDDPKPGRAKILDQTALKRIRGLPEVRYALPVVASRLYVIAPTKVRTKQVEPFVDTAVGVDLRQIARLPISVLAGRIPSPDSMTEVAVTEAWLERYGLDRTQAAAVLGTEIEAGAGRTDAVPEGRQAVIRGKWMRLQVVGVVAQEAGRGSMLVSLPLARSSRAWSASGIDGGDAVGLSPSPFAGVLVAADDLDSIGRVRDRIGDVGYSTSSPENLIASVRRYLQVVEIVLTAIGVIALAVAGLGITNALLAAVRERRREIGVLKAIGARDRDVLRIFLVEATCLGLLGGVVGAALGYVAARSVGAVVNGYLQDQGLVGVQPAVPTVVILSVVAGSAVLALVGGALPALRAARLPAREAVGGS